MIFGAAFWTDVHPATVLLAVATVVLMALIGLILSPAGRPAPPRHRAGGFSRAIADRADGQGGTQ